MSTDVATSATTLALFQPIKVGNITLSHRVAMAPLTRMRATEAHVPNLLVRTHYAQRASTPGTLLITEGTLIAPRAGGFANVPGIWNEAQVTAWKEVTKAVHACGSFIYLQLWAGGGAADPAILAASGHPYISPSGFAPGHTIPAESGDPHISPSGFARAHTNTGHTSVPRALTVAEIQEYVALYAAAAENAVHRAGFDGVEILAANGFLIDQFLQDVSNTRDDEYGGSVEKRAKFALDVVAAVTQAVGAERTGIRLSPFSTYNDMGMIDPYPQFAYLTKQLRARFPRLAYVHAVEPRIDGSLDTTEDRTGASLDFLRDAWAPGVFISAGGYTRSQAIEVSEEKGGVIAFGRAFIANPDLPDRLIKDIPLTKGDRSTYYTPGSDPKGYTDYAFAHA